MVSDAVLNELLMVSPEKAAQMLTENAKKFLRPILLELRGRRDWAVYETLKDGEVW